jgi:hypothetical protein
MFNTYSQNRTNVWELSYKFGSAPKCEMRYENSIMDTASVYRVMSFTNTNTSICDTNGNLILYTNGLTVGNRNYDTLMNAVNFNPGGETLAAEPIGLGSCQSVLILPDPGSVNRYYLFHVSGEGFIADSTYQVQPFHLSYSVIDMTLDGGLGGIVDTLKNMYVVVDTLLHGGLTAVKHANGRDWWVIAHNFYRDKYYKLLLTPNGIQDVYEQTIGSDLMYDVYVQATFSADGSKYCITNHYGWFDYMQFDRCTGEFSDPITVYSEDSLGLYGCSFSPNNRFLYVSSRYNIYQYDTWSTSMVADVIHVAQWDSFKSPISNIDVLFFMHQYAPDGKTYISPWSGVEYLNVINSPDSFGLACNFSPHSYRLSNNGYSFNIPSFPNYDLESLQGSLCDTLTDLGNGIPSNGNSSFSIYPNPTTDWLNIVYKNNGDAFFEMFDVSGKRMAATSLYQYFKNRLIDVSDFTAGVYLVTVTQNGKLLWSEKVVIQH